MVDQDIIIYERIREVERKDEAQMLAEMAGELIDEYVYSFQSAGRTVEGLSWAGTRELAAHMGNIVLGEPQIEEREDHWRVVVQATDLNRNVTVWGGTHQPKKMRLKDGSYQDDDFAFQKALSKAQRNAIKNLLPTTVVKGAIDYLRQRRGQPPRQAAPGHRREPTPVPIEERKKALLKWAVETQGWRDEEAVIEFVGRRKWDGIKTEEELREMYRLVKSASTPPEEAEPVETAIGGSGERAS